VNAAPPSTTLEEADRLASRIAEAIFEKLCDPYRGFDLEYVEEADDDPAGYPVVWVRKSDGARFEIEADVWVTPARPLPDPDADPVDPPHPDQDVLDLDGGDAA
jgi:hypothetical protein